MSFDRSVFAEGVRASLPVLAGVAPFGVICGVAMVASGIAPAMAMLMSLLVFAGILIGAGVPASWRLEFAAPLAFIAMSVPLLRDRAMIAAALAAAITVVLANDLPLRLSVAAAAIVGIVTGMMFERKKA